MYNSDDYDFNEVEVDVDTKDNEHVASNGEVLLTNNVMHAHIGEGDTNVKDNVNQDYEYDATQKLNLEFEKRPASKKLNKKFECEQCPYSAARKSHMKEHVEAVHERLTNYHCDQCPYSAARKHTLKKHIDRGHKTYRRRHKINSTMPQKGEEIPLD